MAASACGTLYRFEFCHGLLCTRSQLISQVLAWCLVFVFIVAFYLLYVPFIHDGWNIGIGVVVGILALVSIVTGIKVSLSDPTDPNVKKNHTPNPLNKIQGRHVIDENYYCSLCEVYV